MLKHYPVLCIVVVGLLISCNSNKLKITKRTHKTVEAKRSTVIVDCNYSYEEAIQGSIAPHDITAQLQLINVQYYSTDGKIHQGQLLTNKEIVQKLELIFDFMLRKKFPIAHAIPIVKYNWNDDLSMQDNNTYSFCYRNVSYSKHARGMAIDINPYFNPLRWKEGYTFRQNKPIGAKSDSTVAGTFFPLNPVVLEFMRLGFKWGHYFPKKYDDHHFEI